MVRDNSEEQADLGHARPSACLHENDWGVVREYMRTHNGTPLWQVIMAMIALLAATSWLWEYAQGAQDSRIKEIAQMQAETSKVQQDQQEIGKENHRLLKEIISRLSGRGDKGDTNE
jgi:hypothetical protein